MADPHTDELHRRLCDFLDKVGELATDLAALAINVRNDLDPDPDLEPSTGPSEADECEDGGDDEGSLGSVDNRINQRHWSIGQGGDLEDEHDGGEPSLGSIEHHPGIFGSRGDQTHWASGNKDDCEGEHDGGEPDADGEPSLAALEIHPSLNGYTTGDQTYWGQGSASDQEHDPAEFGEPEDGI